MTKNYMRIVAVLLLFCFMPSFGLATESVVDYTSNLANPSLDSAQLYGWNKASLSNVTYERATDKDHVRNGAGSLHIKNSSSADSNVNQAVSGLDQNVYYEFSVFINAVMISGEGASVKFKYYDEKNHEIPESTQYPSFYTEAFTNTNNRFNAYKVIFYWPKDVYKVRFHLYVSGEGEAWFDDVTLKSSPPPEKYMFDTDKVFYYKEETSGYACVNLYSYYNDIAADTFVDFAVYKANRDDDDTDDVLCQEETGVKFTNLEAGFTYRTDNWIPFDKYILKCEINDNNGVLLKEYAQNLYRVDRPSMMSEDGYLTVDGKRFNPILGYHATEGGKTYYDIAKEAGMNTVQITSTGANDWEAMHKAGLRGILCLYRNKSGGAYEEKCAGSDYNLSRTLELVNRANYGENGVPSLPSSSFVGFAIMDEPFMSGDNQLLREYCERAYLEIRKIDKVHPIYICDKRNDRISAKYCDIYCIDSYAAGDNTSAVSRETANAWAATKDKNGFWELAATYYGARMPTMNAARNSVWRAFEEGARGIGYYSLSDAMKGRPGYEGKESLDNWEDWDKLCKFNKEEAPILFDYFVNKNGIPFNDYDDGNGAYSVKWFSWISGEDMYLVIHNRSRDEKEICVPLQNKDGTVSVMGFQAEPIGLTTQKSQTGISEISVILASEEIALYKIILKKREITIQRSYDAERVTLICAIYAHNGTKKELITLSMTEETSQNGEPLDVTSTIELPGTSGGMKYTLEVMAWDMHSMQLIDQKAVLK